MTYYRNGRLYVDNGRSHIEFREDNSNHRHFDREPTTKPYTAVPATTHTAITQTKTTIATTEEAPTAKINGKRGDRATGGGTTTRKRRRRIKKKLKDHARQRSAGPTSSRHVLYGNHINKENWTHNSHVEPLANLRSHQEAYWYNNDNDCNSRGGEWQLPQAVAGYYPPWYLSLIHI